MGCELLQRNSGKWRFLGNPEYIQCKNILNFSTITGKDTHTVTHIHTIDGACRGERPVCKGNTSAACLDAGRGSSRSLRRKKSNLRSHQRLNPPWNLTNGYLKKRHGLKPEELKLLQYKTHHFGKFRSFNFQGVIYMWCNLGTLNKEESSLGILSLSPC